MLYPIELQGLTLAILEQFDACEQVRLGRRVDSAGATIGTQHKRPLASGAGTRL